MQPHSVPCLNTLLVGAGVVGRAIAVDHLLSGMPVWLADRDEGTLARSCDWVLQRSESVAESAAPWGAKIDLPMVFIRPSNHDPTSMRRDDRWLLIESIAERLEIKQAFFAEAETWFERVPILTTNTSTISIGKIAEAMKSPERLCGLHFFMPVVDRPAVEIIAHATTDQEMISECSHYAERLGKHPLGVRDGPGFVVNRMLSTYVNLSMWLLCGGVDAGVLEQAAIAYGMPMSPLLLVDLIGPRTAFDGGRTVWSAFPHRMDPFPLLPALIKRKLTGVVGRSGFYAYDDMGNRVDRQLTSDASELVQRYRHYDFDVGNCDDGETTQIVRDLFAATFRIESLAIQKDGIADASTIDRAMRYGLACNRIDCLNEEDAIQLADRFPNIKCIQLPPELSQ